MDIAKQARAFSLPLNNTIHDSIRYLLLSFWLRKYWKNLTTRGGKITKFHGGQGYPTWNLIWNEIYNYPSQDETRILLIRLLTFPASLAFLAFFIVVRAQPDVPVIGQGDEIPTIRVSFTGRNKLAVTRVDWVDTGMAPSGVEGTRFINQTMVGWEAFRRCYYISDGLPSFGRRHTGCYRGKNPLQIIYLEGDCALPKSCTCGQPWEEKSSIQVDKWLLLWWSESYLEFLKS